MSRDPEIYQLPGANQSIPNIFSLHCPVPQCLFSKYFLVSMSNGNGTGNACAGGGVVSGGPIVVLSIQSAEEGQKVETGAELWTASMMLCGEAKTAGLRMKHKIHP